MSKLKQWIGLTMVGVLVVLAAGWFLLISPKRSEATDITLQASQKQSANQVLTTSLALLKSQAKDLPAQQAKLAVVAAKIPANPALPALIRAMDGAAATADVELVSLSPSTPAAFVAATPVLQPVPAAPGVAAAPALQQIALAVNVVGGYYQVEQFLDRVENLTRAFKVTGFTLAPGTNPLKVATAGASSSNLGKTLSATITGQVFMTAVAVAVPVAVAAAPAK